MEENSQAMSTSENTNTDSTYSGNLKQDNRHTKQTKHPGRLLSQERNIHSPVPSVGENSNTEFVRNRGTQTHGQTGSNRRGRGRDRMVERIFEIMEGGDLLDPPTKSEDWKSSDRLGQVQYKVNHDSTLVARSNMVHTLTNRQQQIPYSWRELSDSEPGEGDDKKEGHTTTRKNRSIPHGSRIEQGRKLLTEFLGNINMTRETQQMIIDGQKCNTQKKCMQAMGVFDDWMKEKNYTIENIMNQNIPFIHTEFMTWLIRTRKTKPSSVKHHVSIFNTMLSLILGTKQISTTATLDINQLFEHWRERPKSNLLSNEEKQVKLASLLMSLCFVRMEEMANIDLSVSIIDDQEQRAAVCIPPKQSKKRERYDAKRTQDPRGCPTETFFNWKQADQRYISTRFERLVQTLEVQNTTANSNRHAYSTELAAQDSKINKVFYNFAVNKEQDSIASTLVNNHGEKQATQIILKQRGGARVSEGDGLQQSPLEDDLQLSPQETLASPLSLPIISTQSIVEAESPNDHESAKVQKSQMQKDYQDIDPQDEAQNSSMIKDSDRATTAEAQKC
ncbi:MAG: hypothetical protein EZS28_014158 [Streblomastix strix]|uniref:Tyr recombinase domain-containing protein n=1 Tax=Streblomastix strix TaxID=222440 RepID=A0A5J4W631_9EUKA|nr:MAG: hypothetical protein EZS28_014158 [Streblomastix strix]